MKVQEGYVCLKEWAKDSELEYTDVLSLYKKQKIKVNKIGSTKIAAKIELEKGFISELKEQEIRNKNKSDKLIERNKKKSLASY